MFPSFANDGLGKTSLYEHEIVIEKDVKAIKQRYYPISPAVQQCLYEEIDRMLQLGVIEISKSAWSSPVTIVRKSNGKTRLCLDARKLNSVTEKDAYPLPIIDGLLGRLSETKYITGLDLKDAFWQIPLAESSRDKTAFTVPGRPLYQFRVMPFGLCNAAQSMCRLMDQVIPHELHDRVFVYLDDLLIITATLREHFELLELVADLLRTAGLTINVEKSNFCMREIRYLGYLVGEDGLRTDPKKIEAIINLPSPENVKQTRRLLGMAGWYRRFILNFAAITAPITNCLRKGKFNWTQDAQEAFNQLKTLLTTAPVLVNPCYNQPFFIRCDASTEGVGAVLYQKDTEENERPIAFMSQKLNKAQKNYSVTELECLAAILAVKKFRPYVEGHEFTIITDHASLKWLMGQRDLSGRLARWSLKLQGYHFTIQHQKGKDNVVPDMLSRIYCDTKDEYLSSISKIASLPHINSAEFEDNEYVELRNKIENDPDRFESFCVDNKRILIRLEPKPANDLSDLSIWKLWTPSKLRRELMEKEHCDPLSSHGGITKTLERLRRYYYWPGMAKQVREFIGKCEICKTTKAANRTMKPPMGSMFVIDRPWQRIYIDLLGPYPRSTQGKTLILIVLDHFSKFVVLKTLSKGTSQQIVEFLKNEIFLVYGVPETIHSDNGTQFKSCEYKELLQKFGVSDSKTAVYSPQSNQSERVNRSILAAIRAYIGDKHTIWDRYLPEIASALRNGVHETVKYSPHFLLFGYNKINHGQDYNLLRQLGAISDGDIPLPLPDRLSLIHNQIKANIEKSYQNSAKRYNLRTRPVAYNISQTVFIRTHHQSDAAKKFCAKFAPQFIKGTVTRRIGNVNYEMKDDFGKILGIFHAKDIKPL